MERQKNKCLRATQAQQAANKDKNQKSVTGVWDNMFDRFWNLHPKIPRMLLTNSIINLGEGAHDNEEYQRTSEIL